jgi:hypothetical protein
VRYWEIENETNIPPGWNICCNNDPAAQTAYIQSVKNYVTVLKIAYQTIKAIDPTLQVLIAGICEAGMERFVDELAAQNATQYFDIWSYHPFGPRPEAVKQRLDAFNAKLAQYPGFANKPTWITAIGFHAMAGWTSPGRVASEEMKADYLLQVMEIIRETPGVQGATFWYSFVERSAANGYGLVQFDPTVTPVQKTYLPAYTEYKALWVTKQVAILPPVADNFVSKNNPTSNFANSQTLKVAYGTDIRQAYLQYDLTPLAGQTLLKTQFRFATANVSGAGSVDMQAIRMVTNPVWTEKGNTYTNQPLSILGVISNTAQTSGYQTVLNAAMLNRGTGGRVLLTLDSLSADELIIQSREWVSNPPKLIIYYNNLASAQAAAAAKVKSADELESVQSLASPPMMVEPYPWNVGDPYAGYPTLDTQAPSDEQSNGEHGAQTQPLYLPFVVPQ